MKYHPPIEVSTRSLITHLIKNTILRVSISFIICLLEIGADDKQCVKLHAHLGLNSWWFIIGLISDICPGLPFLQPQHTLGSTLGLISCICPILPFLHLQHTSGSTPSHLLLDLSLAFVQFFFCLIDYFQDLSVKDPNMHGAMIILIIIGSDKTTVLVTMGNNEYWPVNI